MRTSQRVREILFVVGEASGDLHAGKVAEVLRATAPELKMVGIGGATGDLNTQVHFDVIEVLREVQEGVVVLQALGIVAEVVVGQF